MKDIYESPLSSRYADKEMKYLFSPDMKFRTWRRLWIALAEAEKELGLPISQEQIDEINESIIGGVIVNIDDKVIDGSIRHRLQEVKEVIGE